MSTALHGPRKVADGEAYIQGQWTIHPTKEAGDDERGQKEPQTAPCHKRSPLRAARQQRQRVAAGKAPADQGEHNGRTENHDKSGYAMQIANDDRRLDRRKIPTIKKDIPIISSPHQPMRSAPLTTRDVSARASRNAFAPKRQKASDIRNP